MIVADEETSKDANTDVEANETSLLLNGSDAKQTVWNQAFGVLNQILEELKAPPVVAAVSLFVFLHTKSILS